MRGVVMYLDNEFDLAERVAHFFGLLYYVDMQRTARRGLISFPVSSGLFNKTMEIRKDSINF